MPNKNIKNKKGGFTFEVTEKKINDFLQAKSNNMLCYSHRPLGEGYDCGPMVLSFAGIPKDIVTNILSNINHRGYRSSNLQKFVKNQTNINSNWDSIDECESVKFSDWLIQNANDLPNNSGQIVLAFRTCDLNYGHYFIIAKANQGGNQRIMIIDPQSGGSDIIKNGFFTHKASKTERKKLGKYLDADGIERYVRELGFKIGSILKEVDEGFESQPGAISNSEDFQTGFIPYENNESTPETGFIPYEENRSNYENNESNSEDFQTGFIPYEENRSNYENNESNSEEYDTLFFSAPNKTKRDFGSIYGYDLSKVLNSNPPKQSYKHSDLILYKIRNNIGSIFTGDWGFNFGTTFTPIMQAAFNSLKSCFPDVYQDISTFKPWSQGMTWYVLMDNVPFHTANVSNFKAFCSLNNEYESPSILSKYPQLPNNCYSLWNVCKSSTSLESGLCSKLILEITKLYGENNYILLDVLLSNIGAIRCYLKNYFIFLKQNGEFIEWDEDNIEKYINKIQPVLEGYTDGYALMIYDKSYSMMGGKRNKVKKTRKTKNFKKIIKYGGNKSTLKNKKGGRRNTNKKQKRKKHNKTKSNKRVKY